MKTQDSEHKEIGLSDTVEISLMDMAITRLLSSTDEVFNLAAFPILMKPYLGFNEDDNEKVSPHNVIEFDPSLPQGKPEWLKTDFATPIKTISERIEMLIDEMYKSMNAGSLNKKAGGNQKSGEALKIEFQGLNTYLSSKLTKSVLPSEKQVVTLWAAWQGIDNIDDVSLGRSNEFNISSLSDELDNYLIADQLITSETFKKQLHKAVSRKVLPDVSNSDRNAIDDEIEIMKEVDLGELDASNEG
jgi:hypothetical protein